MLRTLKEIREERGVKQLDVAWNGASHTIKFQQGRTHGRHFERYFFGGAVNEIRRSAY